MTIDQARKIVEILTKKGIKARVYEDYSGRGMFGATCPGIECDDIAAVELAAKKIPSKDRPKRRDNLGLSMIVY